MDRRLLDFKNSLEDRVSRLLAHVLLLETSPRDPAAGKVVLGDLRLIEREAGDLSLRGVQRIAGAAAALTRRLQECGIPPLGEYESLLFGAFDSIQLLAQEAAQGVPSNVSPERVASELEAAAEAVQPSAPPPPVPERASIEADPEVATLPEHPERKPLAPPSAEEPRAPAKGPVPALDTRRFLGKFRDATVDHVQRLNQDLLKLEKDPADEERVREVLREIHTLKGESRMMGFADISSLAHAVEDLLKALRDVRFAGLGGVTDLLFGSFDALLSLTGEKVDGKPSGVDVETMAASLRAAARDLASAPPAPPPRAEAPPGAPAAGPAPPPPREETIRVALDKLDALAVVTGDLLMMHSSAGSRPARIRALLDTAKAQGRALQRLRERTGTDVEDLGRLTEGLTAELQRLVKEERDAALRATLAVGELRSRVEEIRMLPVSTLFDFYPRIVRDMARQHGREIGLEILGSETELDRKILEELRDPLVHLIRNAVDHGIEPPAERERAGKPREGSIRLRAAHEGDQILIQVEDDGRGMDPAALRAAAVKKGFLGPEEAAVLPDERALDLIFLSGFSSRETVTDLSGRGVGMDVVRENVARLKGTIHAESEPGRGTTFALRLPLTLSLAHVLLFRAGGVLLAIPAGRVLEVVGVSLTGTVQVGGERTVRARKLESPVPLVDLARLMGRLPEGGRRDRFPVLVLREEGKAVGLAVETLLGEREVLVKGLGPFLGTLPLLSGAGMLPTGEVALLLSPSGVVRAALGKGAAPAMEPSDPKPAGDRHRKRLLVVDDSIVVRDLLRGLLARAGYEVETAVDGEDAWARIPGGGYDLILTEMRLPGMDGKELLARIRVEPALLRTPVLALGTGDQEERRAALATGATDWIPKGRLDPASLVRRVGELVGTPQGA